MRDTRWYSSTALTLAASRSIKSASCSLVRSPLSVCAIRMRVTSRCEERGDWAQQFKLDWPSHFSSSLLHSKVNRVPVVRGLLHNHVTLNSNSLWGIHSCIWSRHEEAPIHFFLMSITIRCSGAYKPKLEVVIVGSTDVPAPSTIPFSARSLPPALYLPKRGSFLASPVQRTGELPAPWRRYNHV